MTFDVDRSTVLLSLRPPYADAILDGRKTIEFRTRPLPAGVETAIIWRTGADGGLAGRFAVGHQARQLVADWIGSGYEPGTPVPGGCITAASFIDYAGGPDRPLWGIAVGGVEGLLQRVPGTSLHPELTRPHQSWRFAPQGWESWWSAAAAGGAR